MTDAAETPRSLPLSPELDRVLKAKGPADLPVAYLAGPSLHRAEPHVLRQFRETARKLRLLSFPIIDPSDFGTSPHVPERQALARNLTLMGLADLVVLLDGWEDSKGATIDFDAALGLGKPVLTLDDYLGQVVPYFYSSHQILATLRLDMRRQDLAVAYEPGGEHLYFGPVRAVRRMLRAFQPPDDPDEGD
jgi:hypothetical protein